MPMRVSWNGHDVPEGLESLPPGEYELVPVEDDVTPDDERAIALAREAADRGEVATASEASRRLRQRFV